MKQYKTNENQLGVIKLPAMIYLSMCILGITDAHAVLVQVPNNDAYSYSVIQDLDGQTSNRPQVSTYNSSAGTASTSRSTGYSGPIGNFPYQPFIPGTFVTSGSASVGADGSLAAYTSIIGQPLSDKYITADSLADYYDTLTVNPGNNVDSVVFHLSLHGTSVGLYGGVNWIDNISISGALDLTSWQFDPNTGVVTGGRGHGRLNGYGDGNTTNADFTIPMSDGNNNTIIFELSLIAFGRVVTSTDPGPVNMTADYSHTARIVGITLLDAVGHDITASTSFSLGRTKPTLSSPQILGDTFAFTLSTLSNQVYTVEQTTNLINWTYCTNLVATNFTSQVLVPISGVPARCFRASKQ